MIDSHKFFLVIQLLTFFTLILSIYAFRVIDHLLDKQRFNLIPEFESRTFRSVIKIWINGLPLSPVTTLITAKIYINMT